MKTHEDLGRLVWRMGKFREFTTCHAGDQRGNVGDRQIVLCEAAQHIAVGHETDHGTRFVDDRHDHEELDGDALPHGAVGLCTEAIHDGA